MVPQPGQRWEVQPRSQLLWEAAACPVRLPGYRIAVRVALLADICQHVVLA